MPIRSLRHVFVPLAVVALAAGLTACRGEDKAPAATDSGPIKIMQIGTFESPNLSLTDAKAGLDAHVQSINAAGGINGRKIEVQFCNDAFNANTGAACARTAVSDGVVAVVGAASSQAPAALPVLEAAGIPWLAGAGSGGPIEGTSSVSYPITGGTQSMQVGMGRLLANKGGKNIAVIVADAAAAYAAADDIANGAKAGGAQSYRVLAPSARPTSAPSRPPPWPRPPTPSPSPPPRPTHPGSSRRSARPVSRATSRPWRTSSNPPTRRRSVTSPTTCSSRRPRCPCPTPRSPRYSSSWPTWPSTTRRP